MPPLAKLFLGLFAVIVLGTVSIHLGLPGPSAGSLEKKRSAAAEEPERHISSSYEERIGRETP